MTGAQEVGLKPCPFCGGEAAVEDFEQYRPGKHSWAVFCNNEPCRFEGGFGGYQNKAEAIAAWNTRAQETDHD